MRCRTLVLLKIIGLVCIGITTNLLQGIAAPPTPPPQPRFGPGGEYSPHDKVLTSGPYWVDGHEGNNNYMYYVVEAAAPKPTEAPVVLFLHGWLANNPEVYGGLISHIVKNGYTVVWVRYQKIVTLPWMFAEHVITTWEDALAKLESDPDRVRPQRGSDNEIQTAYVGHSVGAYLSAILAAKANRKKTRYPNPLALVLIEPGGRGAVATRTKFSDIPSTTKIVIIAGEDDEVACASTAVSVWDQIPQIPDENKDFLLAQTDRTGIPEQIANHFFPTSDDKRDTAAIDARDYYITYKLSIAALNCALYGQDCQYALGNGSFDQIFNGLWSDGTPVKPLRWIENPNDLEVNCSRTD